MRKLVSIQKIHEINPILDADFIEEVVVGGWHTIAKKGEFKTGDLGIFFEIDSLLNPELAWVKEHASFMEARKWRVKTLKMKQVLSQGLALPLSILDMVEMDQSIPIEEDVELTEILGVIKYEVPEVTGGSGFISGRSRGNFPTYLISKTDETRIQSVLRCLDEIRGHPYYISIKCDGTSGTFLYIDEDDFAVCSRNNMKAEDTACVYWKVAEKYRLKEKLRDFEWNGARKRIGLQGECCGIGIQKNKLGLADNDLFIFNVYDIDERRFFNLDEFLAICNKLELKTVPILEVGDSFNYSLEDLLEKAEGKYEGTNNEREGIVIRPQFEMYSEKLKGRMSFKTINNKFLLKEK